MPATTLEAQPNPERLVMAVGATIGLCIVGDSFLYGILPLEAKNLGIALPLVGVFTTASDAGSAMGPLLAYSLGVVLNLNVVYTLTGALLLVAILLYWRSTVGATGELTLQES